MKTYCLQIHNTNGQYFDEIFIFENIEDLVSEFNNKLNYHKNIADHLCAIEEVTEDEVDNEVHGMFMVENADGSNTIGKVYDYHIYD